MGGRTGERSTGSHALPRAQPDPAVRGLPPSGRDSRGNVPRSPRHPGGTPGLPGDHRTYHGHRGLARVPARAAGALQPPGRLAPRPSASSVAQVPRVSPPIRPARRSGDRGIPRLRPRYADGRSRRWPLARPPRAAASLGPVPGGPLVALTRPARNPARVPSRARAPRDGKRHRRIRGHGDALARPALAARGVRPHVRALGEEGRPDRGASLAPDRDLPQARQPGARRLRRPDARSPGPGRRGALGSGLSPSRPDHRPGGSGPARATVGAAGRHRHRLARPAHPGCRRSRLARRFGEPAFHSGPAGRLRSLAHRARIRSGPPRPAGRQVDRAGSGRRSQ